MEETKQWISTDLYLATMLKAFGYDVQVEQSTNPKISNFVIDGLTIDEFDEVQNLCNSYWKKELSIEPHEYIKIYKELKGLAYQRRQ